MDLYLLFSIPFLANRTKGVFTKALPIIIYV